MKRTLRACLALSLIALAVAGCELMQPTAIPTDTPPPTAVTLLPLIPTVDLTHVPGANDPTAAARPSGGAVPLEVEATAGDGTALRGLYYPLARSAPAVLLLHMLGGAKEDWENVAADMQAAGFIVLAVDLRGHGETGRAQDWSLARQDVATWLDDLRSRPNVDAARVGIVGASIGANLALNACADDPACRAVVMLSPGRDYRGVTTEDAMSALGTRPVLLVASEDDDYSAESARVLDGLAQGEHRLELFQNAGHGTRMFNVELELTQLIIDWLKAHL